ncbi:MAG TPA: hypothetical protein VD999_00725 [Vitreimonas sp.]|nr:hypothetical protein [Vitreimonas sp.]
MSNSLDSESRASQVRFLKTLWTEKSFEHFKALMINMIPTINAENIPDTDSFISALDELYQQDENSPQGAVSKAFLQLLGVIPLNNEE